MQFSALHNISLDNAINPTKKVKVTYLILKVIRAEIEKLFKNEYIGASGVQG